ncbi:hypothetical protein AWQ21_14905 (plasmid) [Picosynechococcus sp. PCC 7003]|uniref:hypothetical protein n=1 Tax=Picosynechococcus sp. PCC 7003 TaxID=374981 RepID=UPI0008103C7E|nr:hypothetical protein [Picosynechococcus sp. PCC 7003]ANV85819.1 hypothetical protein AWQ21_14905 [Picosynechococcus sp. PCC 7003]
MSRERLRHSFYSAAHSPLRQVIDDLKSCSGCTLQGELEDALLILRYPYVLQRMGASSHQVAAQAQESIRRLEQEISALRTLLATYGTSSNAVRFQPDAVVQEDSLNIFDIQDNF